MALFIFILVILVSGCTNTNNTTENTTQSPNTPPTTTNNSSFASDIIVKINYQGSWNGTISDNIGNRTVNGVANNNYNLGPNPGNVTVIVRKAGNDNLRLSVQILNGSNVIESQSTTLPFGTVSITHLF